jgi:mannose-6-phosphate isomerase
VNPPSPALREAAHELQAWLVDKAYPLWWHAGADLAIGGFHDRLDHYGRPTDAPKRARVAARQVFCFSLAPRFGWDGPWREAMRQGLDFLESGHRRPDGLYRARADSGLALPDDRGELYDQAFVLLALASAARLGEPTEDRALELLARLPRASLGGFGELDGGGGLHSNPNMHLFEVFIAWAELGGARIWRDLAREQAQLATARLIDERKGAIAEDYDEAWRPAADPADQEIWPGHQFEWAWLLMRHDALSGARAVSPAALRLIGLAEASGVDPRRNVAINALDGRLERRDAMARLWPQTERLKAHLLAAEATTDQSRWSAAERAVEGLRPYLEDSGLWRDQMNAAGDFVEEAAPASSFYHIVGAILELTRIVGRAA